MKKGNKTAKKIANVSMSRKAGLKSNNKAKKGSPNSPGPNYGHNSNKGTAPGKIW